MLARRLMIFAVVLLVVTAISTALAPPRNTAPPPPSGPEPATVAERSVIERTLDTADEDAPVIEVQTGDRLRLTVQADVADAVQLERLGQLKAVAPLTDAVFDLLPTEPGTYPVVLVGEERTVGTIEVVSDR